MSIDWDVTSNRLAVLLIGLLSTVAVGLTVASWWLIPWWGALTLTAVVLLVGAFIGSAEMAYRERDRNPR